MTFDKETLLEQVLAFHGHPPNAKGNFRCLFPEKHRNEDANPSGRIYQGRAYCYSQQCFGERGADVYEVVGRKEQLSTFAEQKAWIEAALGPTHVTSPPAKTQETVYNYTDEQGRLLFQTVRYQPKTFKQRHSDGHAGWIWNLKGVPLVLYRLPTIQAATHILVIEGEKDVETACTLGLPEGYAATTSPLGAGKWKAHYSECLRGKSVIICPDQDEPGTRHGHQIAQALKGIAREILWLELPTGKDLSEWAAPQRTATDFHRLLNEARPFNPHNLQEGGLSLTSLKDLYDEPEQTVDWLVENLLPMGGVSVIGGKPKAGKSTTVRNLIICVAKGVPFLNFPVTQGPVIYCAFEEKREEVRKHFQDLGADSLLPIESFIGQAPEGIVEKIRISAQQLNPVLIVLDTLAKVANVKDFNDYAQMTKALDPFLHVARDTGAHLLFVHHAGKGDRSGGDALLGSTAIFGTVDTCLIQKRSEKYRTLEAICRYGHDLEETVLEWDEKQRAISLGGSKQEADIFRVQEDIRRALQIQEEPVTRETLEEAIEGKTSHKRSALKQLVETHKVERLGKGGKGDPFTYQLAINPGHFIRQQTGETDHHQNTCSLVPGIGGVQGNRYLQNGQTLHEYNPESCSQDLGLLSHPLDVPEQRCSQSEQEVFDLDY